MILIRLIILSDVDFMYSFITWSSPCALLFFNLLMQSKISFCVIFLFKFSLTQFKSNGSIFGKENALSLAHLAKGKVNFCHHLESVVR
jgi:hypothetical protein